MPLILPQSCATCQYFDGDAHCSFMRLPSVPHQFIGILGTIKYPARTLCDLWEAVESKPDTPEDE